MLFSGYGIKSFAAGHPIPLLTEPVRPDKTFEYHNGEYK